MEYQRIINLLDNTPNKPSEFRTKNWVEVNDNSHGTHSSNSQTRYNISILRSSLRDYSDALHIYFLVEL